MKKISLTLVVFFILLEGFSQNVGIGTTTPAFKLDVRYGSINTDSVYRIGTYPVLSTTGTGNLFSGREAGLANTTGGFNSFLGHQSGFANTTGSFNSFMAYQAGYSNTTGNSNTVTGVMSLTPKKFHCKTNNAADPLLWGFIAQDVQKIFPEFCRCEG